VRAFAVAALGRLGGADALAAVRAAWSDSSYGVEAAAIRPLILGDSANRAAWVTRGLAAKSYRDVVRSAALDAVARVGSPLYTAQVDSLRGETASAANALAILSVRGDSAALKDLVRALDDTRPFVREWSLRAVRRLPADLRDPPLTAAFGSLRDEKTKAAIDTLLHPQPALPAH
jgi:HEAT repeat protein